MTGVIKLNKSKNILTEGGQLHATDLGAQFHPWSE